MRVAALYDIHAMADALAAVLAEVEREGVDAIVVGGDSVAGPQPAETLALLRAVRPPVHWIRGNCDRWLGDEGPPPPGGVSPEMAFVLAALAPDDVAFLLALPGTVSLDVDGLGRTLFCHATPRSDMEIVTPATPDHVLRRALAGVEERIVVAGHTHMQLDRCVDDHRWVNAGSVGMPYEGEVSAFWALLGPGVELRRTSFDNERAAAAIRATGWPEAVPSQAELLERPPTRAEATAVREQRAADRGER